MRARAHAPNTYALYIRYHVTTHEIAHFTHQNLFDQTETGQDGKEMTCTPSGSGFYSRPASRKRLSADEVSELAAQGENFSAFPYSRSGNRGHGDINENGTTPVSCRTYQPNESLYDGSFRELNDSEDEEVHLRALAGSSGFNSSRGQQPRIHADSRYNLHQPHDNTITAMLQEQQKLLHQVLATQKKMQQKQDEFDTKLKELSKRSESSGTSDGNGKRKCRITRDLTVS